MVGGQFIGKIATDAIKQMEEEQALEALALASTAVGGIPIGADTAVGGIPIGADTAKGGIPIGVDTANSGTIDGTGDGTGDGDGAGTRGVEGESGPEQQLL